MREHLLAHLVCPGRHTITSLITVFGKQFRDWTADYSLYAKDRVNEEVIFRQVRKELEALSPATRPLCIALDDTILRKTGKTIPGAAYRKDPLGPPFNLNLVWAQRRLQLSAAVADENNEVRMIPIAFQDASAPRKPRKSAPVEQVELYKEQMKQRNLNALATDALRQLQQERAEENAGTAPELHVVVDGSYTNRKMLRNLPEKTTLIGHPQRRQAQRETRRASRTRTQALLRRGPAHTATNPPGPGHALDYRAGARERQMAGLRSQNPGTHTLEGGQIYACSSSVRLDIACAKGPENYTPNRRI